MSIMKYRQDVTVVIIIASKRILPDDSRSPGLLFLLAKTREKSKKKPQKHICYFNIKGKQLHHIFKKCHVNCISKTVVPVV